MSKQLPQAIVSAIINEADDTNVTNVSNEHASAGAEPTKSTKRTGVEYIGNNVISTDEPTKISDIVFFGIVKGW